MRTVPAPEGVSALDDALRRAVFAASDDKRRAARAEAETLLNDARREGGDVVEHARREATATADAAIAHERAALRREVSATILTAKRAVVQEVEAQVRDAVLALRMAPDYPRLLDGLEARARAQLGAETTIRRDPAGLGGVVAEGGGRRVDYTLAALARLALADVEPAIEEMLR